MPVAAPRPCTYPGCAALVRGGSRCEQHKRTWDSDKVRGNRHQRGYGSKWTRLRKLILERDNYLCQECLSKGRLTALVVGKRSHPNGAQVDHIIPKARGGTDDPSNLRAICRTCHEAKTARE